MKKVTLSLLLLVSLFTSAQSFSWLETPPITFGLNPENIGYTTTADPLGNVYFAGFKDDAFPYDNILGNVYYNKYGANGELLFSKTITGHVTVFDMVSDHDGNILMAVGYANSIGFDNVALLTVSQDVQPLLVKFSPDGSLLWYLQPGIDSDAVPSQFRTVAVDDANHIYIGYGDFLNSYVTKLAPDGSVLFTVTQQHVRSVASVSVDNAGNIYSAGSCAENNAEFAGVSRPAPFGYNTYIAKYDQNGAFQWVQYVEDVTCPLPQVKAFSPDAVYFSSYLFGPVSFGSIIAEGPVDNFGFTDVFIAKLNAVGNFEWVREVPGSGELSEGNRNFMALDAGGNLYYAGRTRGTVHWNANITTSVTGFANDAVFLEYTPDGEVVMAVTAGGASEDRFDGIAVDGNGGIYLSGMCTGGATFGSIAHEAPEFTYYPFLVKVESLLGVDSQALLPPVRFYPNPVGDYLNISGIGASTKGSIFNVLGMKVKEFKNTSVFVGDLPQGIYLVKATNASAKIIKK